MLTESEVLGASMARAYHYIADRFYRDLGAIGGLRKESDRMVARNDAEAVKEAMPLGLDPSFWQVRKITKFSNRAAYKRVIFDSRDQVRQA
jgi:hypothetical protein